MSISDCSLGLATNGAGQRWFKTRSGADGSTGANETAASNSMLAVCAGVRAVDGDPEVGAGPEAAGRPSSGRTELVHPECNLLFAPRLRLASVSRLALSADTSAGRTILPAEIPFGSSGPHAGDCEI